MGLQSAKEIWEAAKGALQIQLTKANYDTWLKDTIGVSYREDQLVVGTPNAFAAEWLEKRLHSLVKKTLISIVGGDIEVQFQVYQNQPSTASPVATQQQKAAPVTERIPQPRLNQKYTFDTFIVGSCNRLAHAAALGVAENPGLIHNPLFIYGGVGLGKTHLLHAIGHVAFASGYRVLYITTEQFTNEFINAIKEGKSEQFRERFRNVDLLLIDDIHFISGKEQTQESFFHTFNDLHNANRQISITSDRLPQSMPLLEDRLRSRFEWGLIADIQPPDLETRLAILQVQSEKQQISISEDILEFIARRYPRNIRELEGSLNRVISYAKLVREPLTLELAQQALKDIDAPSPPHIPEPEFILNAVSRYFHLELEALKGEKREQPIARARQIAMYLMREETHHPLTEIGKILGGRDHSTVLHGCQKIGKQIGFDPDLRREVLEIKEMLYPNST